MGAAVDDEGNDAWFHHVEVSLEKTSPRDL